MPFELIRNDITKMDVDAIVNAANESLLGGGGVDGAIHAAAGPRLLEECRTLGGCRTGEAKLTRGYNLPARYVIHTVGPVWQGGGYGEEQLLRSCYRNALRIAAEHGFESLAFPLISSGIYGYPKAEALRVATEEIQAFLRDSDMLVYLIVFDRTSLEISEGLYARVKQFIDDVYADAHTDFDRQLNTVFSGTIKKAQKTYRSRAPKALYEEASRETVCDAAPPMDASLEDMLSEMDAGFSETLLRLIDERGMKDSECYRRANIDRRLFSKIRDVHYNPSKRTAIALALALHLSLNETRDLIRRAGYALSRSNKFDVIIEFFIREGNYDIFEINQVLFKFDQPLLGG